MSPRVPHRFYCQQTLDALASPQVELSAAESHHLLHVLRLKEGAPVELFDAQGQGFLGRIAAQRGGVAMVEIENPIPGNSKDQTPEVGLAVAVIKRRGMDWMLEKLSELGVSWLQPLLSARSIARGDMKPGEEPPERWDRLCLAASKQCGRNKPMLVRPALTVEQWLACTQPAGPRAFAHLTEQTQPAGAWITAQCGLTVPQPVTLAIGPEGGWTPAEASLFLEKEFTPVSLGSLTLRTETAALAAAAACRLACGDS